MTSKLDAKQAADFLLCRDGFLILTHIRPDGDTTGSAAALCRILRDAGKTAYVLNNDGITPKYSALLESFLAPPDFMPDTLVAVDIANTSLVPVTAAGYLNRLDLAVDHHTKNNLPAENMLLDSGAASTGELIHRISLHFPGGLTPEAASDLYVAVATDTGCFRYANTTAETHRTAATLIESGADAARLNRMLFETKTPARIAIERELYSNLEYHENGAVAVIIINLDLIARTGASEDDIDDLSSLPRQIEGVLAGITVRELKPGVSKISMRSQGCINSAAICALHGGGGHVNAAGCTLEAGPDEAVALILPDVKRALMHAK